MNIIINIGKLLTKMKLFNISLELKSDKIAKRMCPAVKFAANLMPRAIGLDKWLANSIAIRKGASGIGDPLGINMDKNLCLKFQNPIILTPNQALNPNPKVKLIWVVTGKVYNINPIMLMNSK